MPRLRAATNVDRCARRAQARRSMRSITSGASGQYRAAVSGQVPSPRSTRPSVIGTHTRNGRLGSGSGFTGDDQLHPAWSR